MTPLFEVADATIGRASGPVVCNVNWVGESGRAWAIVGPTGSGKTTLLEALAGKHRISQGTRVVPGSVALVGFREDSRLFSPSNFYYQQRFEFGDADDSPTAREFLESGSGMPIKNVVEQFHLADLLDLKLLKLSNGQQRRLRIAKGLLKRPALLLLDNPHSGLDTATRAELDGHLSKLVESGLCIVLTCRANAVPHWVTRVFEVGSHPVGRVESSKPDGPKISDLIDSTRPTSTIIELSNVTVRHGGTTILEGIDWTVRRGERWAILGPNGSGKTTLLSLLCGDHPQAFGNDVKLFGVRRGSGETIWELKRRIGLASPEMHQYFPRMLTARDAVASGFCDRFAPESLTPEQEARVEELMVRFELMSLREVRWWQLPTGTQRLLLLLRAVVKRPELLILDEPFQGMDAAQIGDFHRFLAGELTADQTLLVVVHDEAELPAGITRVLRLDRGRVVAD